ncbi:response regulator transcription factor [Streptomyces sp. NPDC047981]|uniref:response regulator transcription factor n=1 Tax=Streptomyces sp. NPDC047981 TaxID=3154610 RepID=UPI00341D605D
MADTIDDRPQLRVLIVDDHPLFRSGLRAALDSAVDVEVVGEAGDAEALGVLVDETRPHVVVMDMGLPGISGTEAVRGLGSSHPGLPVLMLTMAQDDASLLAALRAGARGYLVKGAGRDAVLNAVRTVATGGAVFGPEVADRIAAQLAGVRRAVPDQPFPELTQREAEVLELVARGYDNRRIARELVLSEKTVRNHVSRVFAKLQVAHRAEAVSHARDAGLGATPPSQVP